MNLRTALTIVLFSLAGPAIANDAAITNVRWIEIPIGTHPIARSGQGNCSYGAILNCLRFGNAASKRVFESLPGNTRDRINNLKQKYGSRPSREHGKGIREREDGVSSSDVLDTYNEFRQAANLPLLQGQYLNRGKTESQKEHSVRVHQLIVNSLKQGEPPLVTFKAQAPHWDYNVFALIWDVLRGRNLLDEEFRWQELAGHCVTVTGVPESTNVDGSFCLNYLDPDDGVEKQALIYGNVRNFGAQKGIGTTYEWLKDRPFLCVTSGSTYLGVQKQIWSLRTEIYLDYAIYQK